MLHHEEAKEPTLVFSNGTEIPICREIAVGEITCAVGQLWAMFMTWINPRGFVW